MSESGDGQMLDFMLDLEKILKVWPDNTKWSLVQIAERTGTILPRVSEYMNTALGSHIDIHEPMTFNEATKAWTIMQDRLRGEIKAREEARNRAVRHAIDSWDGVREKVRVMQAARNFRGAYKTMSYFYGIHREMLPADIIVSICDDCLRLGIRGGINYQEITSWMSIAIRTLMKHHNGEVVEDALDFLDAYGDYFLTEPNGRGEHFLTNIFLSLKPSAMEFNLTDRLNEVAGDLNLNTVMDVIA